MKTQEFIEQKYQEAYDKTMPGERYPTFPDEYIAKAFEKYNEVVLKENRELRKALELYRNADLTRGIESSILTSEEQELVKKYLS